jgi:hypothetical protein
MCQNDQSVVEINDNVFVLYIVSTPANKLHMVIQG